MDQQNRQWVIAAMKKRRAVAGESLTGASSPSLTQHEDAHKNIDRS
jgi:hypothetical protein